MMGMVNSLIRVRCVARIRKLFLVACLAFLCVGCEDVASTSPLVGEGQAIIDDRLLGTWVDPDDLDDPADSDDPVDQFVVERDQKDRYRFTSFEGGETQEFFVQLTQIGSHRFLQIAVDCSMHLFFQADSNEQCYLLMKVKIEDNSFSLTALDHERLFQDSLDKKLSVEHEIRRQVRKDGVVRTCMILTAPTEELRRFLQSYTADDSVFGESNTSVRKRGR